MIQSKIRNHLNRITRIALLLFLAILVLGRSRAEAESLIGLTSTGNLVTFDSSTPGVLMTSVGITGLQGGEVLLGIDIRPATGFLFGLGSASSLYTINTTTGAATLVGTFSPVLTGTAYGFDFIPVTDRIRVISNDTSNFRLNPNNATLAATDTPLSYAAGDSGFGSTPRVVGAAYSNNFNGATLTTLYGIDSSRDVLVSAAGTGNTGVLTTIGSLGVNTSDLVGFDVSGATGVAYASLTPVTGGPTQLYTINVTTGGATLVGTIGTGLTLTGLAAGVGTSPVPEPSSVLLLTIGGAALIPVARRRRS